jgi:MFS family permease
VSGAAVSLPASGAAAGPRPAAFTLIVLAVALALGNVMLSVFSAVQEAAKADLGLSDFSLSLLNGLAVSIPVAVLSLPVGILVDRGNRVVLMLWTSFAWSLGTLLTAVAETMPVLFAARMLAGVGSNIATTIAISLAADLCLRERRGRSLLLLTIGKYAGTGLAFTLGGALLAWFTDTGGLFDLSAWRSVHLALGLLSLAGTATLLFLREPARREVSVGPSAPLRETFAELWSYRRFLAPLFLGQLGVFMADASAAIWAAPVLQRSYGLGPADFAGWMGLVVFGAGILGALIGGIAADLGQKRVRRGAVLDGAVIAALLALPAAAFPLAPGALGFGVALFVLLLGGTVCGLVTATAMAVLLPNELRGVAIGVFVALAGLIAFGVAPTLVVALSGPFGGESGLAPALATMGAAVSLLGCIGFYAARRNAPEPIR